MQDKPKEELLTMLKKLQEQNAELERKVVSHKEKELALKESEEKLKGIVDSFNDGIYITSPDYIIQFLNKAMMEKVGEDKIGHKCYRVMYNRNKPCPWCQYEKLNKNNKIISYDFQIPDTDEYRMVRNNLLDDGSKMTTYYDITQRKKAEEAHRASEEKAKFLSDVTFEGIVTHKKGIVFDANESFLKMTGYKKEEVIGENLLDYIPRVKDKAKIMVNIIRQKAKPYTIMARRKNGTTFIAELEARNIKHGGQTIRIVAVRDVTERIKSEKALKESKETAERYLNIAAQIIISLDTKGNIKLLNDSGYRLLGYENGELIGKNWFETCIPKNKVIEVKDVLDIILKGESEGVDNYENQVITRSGEIKDIHWYNSILKDGDKIYGLLSSGEDVTFRKQREEELKKNLREKEILIREVHHRVKNNMQVIAAILSLQASEIGDERLSSVLDACQSRIQSMSKVHEMMYRTSDLEHMEMGQYIHEMIKSLKELYPLEERGITIVENCKDVFMNLTKATPSGIIINELISNAMKHAFPGGHKGEIEVKLGKIDGNIKMSVSNNGVPLPESFNIKKPTSLGLEIVNMLTEQLQGQLTVTSTKDRTVFDLSFPI